MAGRQGGVARTRGGRNARVAGAGRAGVLGGRGIVSALVRRLGAGLGAVVVLLLVLLSGSHARVETASEVPKVAAEKCRRCHDRAFAQRAAVQRATMDMSDCATCHGASRR